MAATAGDPVTATVEQTQDSYTSGRPICRLVQLVTQVGIANNTITAITFTSEDVDTHGFHDNAVNTSRITPTVAGWYRFNGAVAWAGQTDYTGVEAYIRPNAGSGLAPAGKYGGSGAVATTLVAPTGDVWYLMNGTTDYMELMGRHIRAGAGTSSTVISSQFTSVFQCEFMRPA